MPTSDQTGATKEQDKRSLRPSNNALDWMAKTYYTLTFGLATIEGLTCKYGHEKKKTHD